MYEISIKDTFDAAHCIRNYNGNCSNLHGHTYKVVAKFRFYELDESGMAIDFRVVKDLLNSILSYMDHQYINDLPEFSVQNPTAEALAKFVYDKLKAKVPESWSVSVWETPTSYATYRQDE